MRSIFPNGFKLKIDLVLPFPGNGDVKERTNTGIAHPMSPQTELISSVLMGAINDSRIAHNVTKMG